jgi:hypothetical protein
VHSRVDDPEVLSRVHTARCRFRDKGMTGQPVFPAKEFNITMQP